MPFNYNKLRGKIIEVFRSQQEFANAMGWSERTTSLKMTGQVAWKQTDICKAVELLGLSEEDIPKYFFAAEVQNIEQ